MQIRFFPWRWSELQIKIFSYLFCRIFSISYSILHCKMLFENGFKRRIRWRNNGVGATVDSEMKMHWNEEVLRILAQHFRGLSNLVSDNFILHVKKMMNFLLCLPSLKNRNQTQSSKPVRNFSVHIIGIDSASRLNVHRLMPRMCELTKQLGGIEFQGFNKVGLNTRENLVPALTGQFYK